MNAIRSKPDTKILDADLERFLDGGAAAVAENTIARAASAPPPAAPAPQGDLLESGNVTAMVPSPGSAMVGIAIKRPEPVESKFFRLRWDTAAALKVYVAQRSAEAGQRITETQVVETLLRKHLKKAGLLES